MTYGLTSRFMNRFKKINFDCAYQLGRHLQLGLQMYNLAFQSTIFGAKVIALAVALGGGAVFILSMHNNDFSIENTVLNLNAVAIGLGLYYMCVRRICTFPAKIEHVRRRMAFVSFGRRVPNSERRLRQKLGVSIPVKGFKDGGFRYFERQTPMVFFEYFLTTLADIVIGVRSI